MNETNLKQGTIQTAELPPRNAGLSPVCAPACSSPGSRQRAFGRKFLPKAFKPAKRSFPALFSITNVNLELKLRQSVLNCPDSGYIIQDSPLKQDRLPPAADG